VKVYLASRYSRRDEMLAYAADLRAIGHEVTSRWILGLHETPPAGTAPDSLEHWAWCAQDDLDDIGRADVLVAFTEPEGAVAGRARGGRHVELGYALALGKRVIVVGHVENVFCALPGINFYRTWPDALAQNGGEL
jgi:nucleoside 2-deoxyribosyltransferase